jgi:hypothetical protein
MIGIITITAAGSTAITITLLLRNIRFNSRLETQKGGTWRFPLLPFCCVVSEAR